MRAKATENGVRDAADEAVWTARETAWRLEERILWPLSDGARLTARRIRRALEPLQRLVQTRLLWPLGDRLADYGPLARTALATGAVLAVAGASIAGLGLASDGGVESGGPATIAAPARAPAGTTETLAGVTPDFETNVAETGAGTRAKPAAVPPNGKPAVEPVNVAWSFAEAFVRYEVGEVDEKTAATFGEVASPPLAKSLAEEPPRLPEGARVPEAKVLNVVLSEPKGAELEASVSLLRLQAASELRLTLTKGEQGWKVAEVRG